MSESLWGANFSFMGEQKGTFRQVEKVQEETGQVSEGQTDQGSDQSDYSAPRLRKHRALPLIMHGSPIKDDS